MPKPAPFWMVSPKNFISLIGAEYELMHQSGESVLKKFYFAAILILSIMIISFLSIFYAVELLTHIVLVEIILSTFLSILFALIYIFLINTFSKEKNSSVSKSFFVFSNVTRFLFVVFIAFLISKPIEIFIFQRSVNKDIENYKQKLLSEHTIQTSKIFDPEILIYQNRIRDLKNQSEIFNSKEFDTEVNSLSSKIDSIDRKKTRLLQFANAKIETSGYFIFRIKQVFKKYPIVWLISFIFISLFVTPVLLIYSISANAKYYESKKAYERDIIQKEYFAFTEKYTELFQNNFGFELQFYSKYKDPPFNTIVKENNKYRPSKDFLEKYCPD